MQPKDQKFNNDDFYDELNDTDNTSNSNESYDEEYDNYDDEDEEYDDSPHYVRKFLKYLFITIFSVGLLGILGGIGLFAYYAKSAPQVTQRQLINAGSSQLYTSDGKYLLTLGQAKRKYLRYNEIPQTMKDAVISIEDKRFYEEAFGIDPLRTAKALIDNIRGHDISSGGSTITQQLIKLSAFSTKESDRTLKRKAQEAWIALHISREYSREQILEYYINKVYMGYDRYGLGTASEFYYGKPANELDLAQTALLAGMPNAPIMFDPYVYPARATQRRNMVLQAMLRNKKITQQQYDQASTENVQTGLAHKHSDQSQIQKIDDPYIKEVVNEAQAAGYDPYHDNLKITVNIDQKAQNKLYKLANSGDIPFTNNKMQVGATVVDPNNGNVVAIIGGRHLPDVSLGLNRAAQTSRSTGSSIKPILDYAPAIQYLHWSTAQVLSDTPYTYKGTNIQLYDWDNRYYGNMTMRYALEQSRNVPAVKTLEAVGLGRASKFTKQMGITVEPSQGLSVGIGANASSLQMAGAYSALADYGIYHKPRFVSKIETVTGEVENFGGSGTRVMDESTAYMITDMLKGVITKGSGTKAKIDNLIQAGKTGTVKYSDQELKLHPSYNETPKDSWFVGYTRNYVMSIWTGYDNLKDGKIDNRGQNAAMLLYKDMMSYLMEDKANADWTKPSSVVTRQYNTGTELYQKGHAPATQIRKRRTINRLPREVIRRYQQNPETVYGGVQGSTQRRSNQTQQIQPNQNRQNNNVQNYSDGNNGQVQNNNQQSQQPRVYYYYRTN